MCTEPHWGLRHCLAVAAGSRRWCDVTLHAGGKLYRAHRLVLSCASPFIRTLLESKTGADLPTAIVLADVSGEVVEALLQYIYSGEVNLQPQCVQDFLDLTETLHIKVDRSQFQNMNERLKDCEKKRHGDLINGRTMIDFKSKIKVNELKDESTEIKCHKSNVTQSLGSIFSTLKKEFRSGLDLEALIKSDKIIKSGSVLSKNRIDDGKTLGYDVENMLKCSKYKNCFLKSILSSKVNLTNEDKFDERKSEDGDCEVNVNGIEDIEMNTTEKSVIDNFSDSSCEILEVSSTKDNTYISENLRTKNLLSDYNIQNGAHNIQNKPCLLNESTKYPSLQKNTNIEIRLNNINDCRTLRNEKVVRPIPSLMPIEILSSALDLTKKYPVRLPPALLDLTHMNVTNFERNLNSAFERVNNTAKSSVADLSREGYMKQLEYLQSQKSLRQGFDVTNPYGRTGDGNLCNLKESCYSSARYFEKHDTSFEEKIKKKIQLNKVLESPWSVKGPSYYRPQQRVQNVVSNVEDSNTRSPPQATSLTSTPQRSESFEENYEENCKRNSSDRSNDSNNNVPENENLFVLENERRAKYDEQKAILFSQLPKKGRYLNGLNIHKSTEEIKSSNKGAVLKQTVERNSKYLSSNENAFKYESNLTEKPTVRNDLTVYTNAHDKSRYPILSDSILPLGLNGKDALPLVSLNVEGSSTLGATGTTNARARYRCDQCDKCFSQLRNYKYHVSVHRGTKEFAATCNVCGKYFNDRGYLSSHMKIHRNRKEYQCPHCPKSFNQRVAYNMHVRIHTGVKPHQCEACGKAFSRKMLLKQHARTHSGEKPYACTACGKKFADRSNMTLHMRLHSGVKPFSCTLCPKSFTKKHHLKTHLNYHTGNKPYTCVKCGLAFSQSSNMRTHMKKCAAAVTMATDGGNHGDGQR